MENKKLLQLIDWISTGLATNNLRFSWCGYC